MTGFLDDQEFKRRCDRVVGRIDDLLAFAVTSEAKERVLKDISECADVPSEAIAALMRGSVDKLSLWELLSLDAILNTK